jgi:hypothetical protein
LGNRIDPHLLIGQLLFGNQNERRAKLPSVHRAIVDTGIALNASEPALAFLVSQHLPQCLQLVLSFSSDVETET